MLQFNSLRTIFLHCSALSHAGKTGPYHADPAPSWARLCSVIGDAVRLWPLVERVTLYLGAHNNMPDW